MNERIVELRKYLNLTQFEFAEKIGLKQSSFSDIENNKAPITERTIISICAIFHVNEQWLRSGIGTMFIENNKLYDDFFSIFSKLSKPLQDFLIQTAKNLLDTQNKL